MSGLPKARIAVEADDDNDFNIDFYTTTNGVDIHKRMRIADDGVVTIHGDLIVEGDIETGAHAVGESYGGGIVFYVNEAGTHGLIAGMADFQNESSLYYTFSWYESHRLVTNPSKTGGEYTDWRIPSLPELSLMYENLHLGGLGAFENQTYWSSSMINSLKTNSMNFLNGYIGEMTIESQIMRVRAVRSF